MNRRALVLGGGGSTGNAWLIGIAAGLFDAGLDVTGADVLIGTSAGSTTAAQITCAASTQMLAEILSDVTRRGTHQGGTGGRRIPMIHANQLETTSQIIGTSESAADMRRKLGAAALEMAESSDSSAQERWRATVASRLPSQHWPRQPLLVTAVDAGTGEPMVFNSDMGIDLVDAVAASCAGGFAYTIGHNQYIDGGYRADVNADLAAGCERVLIIPPLGDRTRKPLGFGLHLAAQIEELRARGSMVETIFPDNASESALGDGINLMDISMRKPSAQAGYNQGKNNAQRLKEFWRR